MDTGRVRNTTIILYIVIACDLIGFIRKRPKEQIVKKSRYHKDKLASAARCDGKF